jgi:hypothetical protein
MGDETDTNTERKYTLMLQHALKCKRPVVWNAFVG